MAYFKDDLGHKFDFDSVLPVKERLSKVEVGNWFIVDKTLEEIEGLLSLQARDEEGLRAVRNAVVYVFSQDIKKADDTYPLSRLISGITAVIDSVLWNKGYPV